jgi:hypothetical protein
MSITLNKRGFDPSHPTPFPTPSSPPPPSLFLKIEYLIVNRAFFYTIAIGKLFECHLSPNDVLLSSREQTSLNFTYKCSHLDRQINSYQKSKNPKIQILKKNSKLQAKKNFTIVTHARHLKLHINSGQIRSKFQKILPCAHLHC